MPTIFRKVFSLSTLALLVALMLSSIAAWYSVAGLTAIFAAAVTPIMIMGGSLEFAKVVTTIWLHRYWDKCKLGMKSYLTLAVVVLAIVTSMGIFGFLSKAHMDQGVPTGDIAAQISLIDEKINSQKEYINSERDNIESARKTISQMDAQVSARLDRGTNEQSAERSVQIRAQQKSERAALTKEIATSQDHIEQANSVIAQLNQEKAPIAAKFRKVEAEVGPIKYIAALIYGDNPDQALLERAVRWVIILLIFVFDPLALMLVIAAISSYKWELEITDEIVPTTTAEPLPPITEDVSEVKIDNNVIPTEPIIEPTVNDTTIDNMDTSVPLPKKKLVKSKRKVKQTKVEPIQEVTIPAEIVEEPVLESIQEPIQEPKPDKPKVIDKPINTVGVTLVTDVGGGYVKFNDGVYQRNALKELRPDLFAVRVDNGVKSSTNFGTQFPKIAAKGDIFVRVDVLPNRAYKFDGNKWIEQNKTTTQSYLYNKDYIEFLIEKIKLGEYDLDMLSEHERAEIESYLKGN